MTNKKNLVVVGNGMVGHKFLELMVQKAFQVKLQQT